VSTDPHRHSHILMNMDIDFPNVPCFLLDIGVSTSVNSMNDDEIFERLIFKHMDQDEKIIASMNGKDPFRDYNAHSEATAAKIQEFYSNEHYCKVEGTIEITKVTGQLTFRLRGETAAYQKFKRDN